ncbi:unnamed protein product [Acanthosepion pharaonis]|uniref:Uncharacterized protein n=1 Tax=Acanthosepion pharaonis TaxID=158019 RepID=A0A812CEC6_ACAPH|nr:unnamed protein product [Sepia pharaonis]
MVLFHSNRYYSILISATHIFKVQCLVIYGKQSLTILSRIKLSVEDTDMGIYSQIVFYFLSFSIRRLGAWLTIKQKMRPLSLSSWYDSILARDGLFFLSFFLFSSRALFKGLVTVETAFFLFDIATFHIRRQTGPSIRLGDEFSSQFRKHIFSAHMPRHLTDVLPARKPGQD